MISATVEVLAPPAQTRYKFDATAHLHTLDNKPLMGTSTVCSEALPKPGLTWWAAELAAVECLDWAAMDACGDALDDLKDFRREYEAMSKLTGKDKKNGRDRLQRKYPVFKKARYAHREAKESKAVPGTDMHKSLEAYINECIYDYAGYPFEICDEHGVQTLEESGGGVTFAPVSPEVHRFSEWALENVQEFLWSEAHCYSERLWTGGICDCGAILKDGTFAVIDFKSSSDAYFSQFVQAGGYSLQIQEQGLFTATGTTVSSGIKHVMAGSLIVIPFGAPECKPVIKKDVGFWQEQFRHAVGTYKGLQQWEKENT